MGFLTGTPRTKHAEGLQMLRLDRHLVGGDHLLVVAVEPPRDDVSRKRSMANGERKRWKPDIDIKQSKR